MTQYFTFVCYPTLANVQFAELKAILILVKNNYSKGNVHYQHVSTWCYNRMTIETRVVSVWRHVYYFLSMMASIMAGCQ
jgi:hypothetical protein